MNKPSSDTPVRNPIRPFPTLRRPRTWRWAVVLPALISLACSFSLLEIPGLFGPTATPSPAVPLPPTGTPIPEAEITFRARIPPDTPGGESIQLTLLDEVTGLALNPRTFVMQAEGVNLYAVTIRAAAGSVVKYRYGRQGQGTLTAAEHTSDGRPVRYRLVRVDGPGVVDDLVTRWNDTLYNGPAGRIQGQVTDAATGRGVPNILVTAAGFQTLTASDGSFLVEGIPPGTHNIVAYALDGVYQTYQQGAIVDENATTPAPLQLQPSPLVNITFSVMVPEDTIPGVPVRVAGNLSQFGNTFADLAGGITIPANRMPVLNSLPENRYSLSLTLPVGADLRYKYTLGDGFWNSEQTRDGEFRLRQLIVPDRDHVVEEVVSTWESGNSKPIWFDVTVPENTPVDEVVSIQFNPYGWTEPIPMWSLGGNRWVYRLTSPLNILGTIGYRYCRNNQCGVADDAVTSGDRSGGRPVSTSLLPQNLQDRVTEWQWLPPISGPITVPGVPITKRSPEFVTGIELQTDHHPSWTPHMDLAMRDVAGVRAGWVVLTPGWTYTRLSPPVLELIPGGDPLWHEVEGFIQQGQDRGLSVALRPILRSPVAIEEWWAAAPRDAAWWDAWFEAYRRFLLHHADLAARQNAAALILGGVEVQPALPGGELADGSPSGVPEDAEARWRRLVQDVRRRYGGTLGWALPYHGEGASAPAFLDDLDQIYLLWSAPLASRGDASGESLLAEASRLLDEDVLPLQSDINNPLVISVAYPSAEGGVTGCLPDGSGGCLDPRELSPPRPDRTNLSLDLNEQVEAYNALLTAINERNWVSGLVARGYYPPAALRDKSISVHGKPAADLLSYWFPRLRGLE